jgi:hypothetical protein
VGQRRWSGIVVKGHVAQRRWKTKAGTKTGWYVVIDIGRDLDGERRQKWHGSSATRAEAETHRVALVAELEAGTYVEPSALTLDEYETVETLSGK